MPFGLFVGGVGAAFNEFLRNKQISANEYAWCREGEAHSHEARG